MVAEKLGPDALLVYNDYNVEQPRKREKLMRLIRELRAKNVPLNAIGLGGPNKLVSRQAAAE